MSLYLPDVNVVIALLDPLHIHHDSAHSWFKKTSPALILCSHVVNGVMRVMSHSKYKNSLTTNDVREALLEFFTETNALFCEKEISLLHSGIFKNTKVLTHSLVSDMYLLALGIANGAKFATFDRGIPVEAISGGPAALEIIPSF